MSQFLGEPVSVRNGPARGHRDAGTVDATRLAKDVSVKPDGVVGRRVGRRSGCARGTPPRQRAAVIRYTSDVFCLGSKALTPLFMSPAPSALVSWPVLRLVIV